MAVKQKRRILRRFKLEEISTVDKPAVEGALMTLVKRAGPHIGLVPDLTKQSPQEQPPSPDLTKLHVSPETQRTLEEMAAAIRQQTHERQQEAENMTKREPKTIAISRENFDQLAKAVQVRTQCAPHDAAVAVHMAFEDGGGKLLKLLGGEGVDHLLLQGRLAKAKEDDEVRGSDFPTKVDDMIRANPKLTRIAAVQQARRQYPEIFQAYRAA